MRADAAPFVPSILLSSSNYDRDTERKTEQQHEASSRQRRRRRRGKQLTSSSKDKSSPSHHQQPKQNEPRISSQTSQKQKQQKRRSRRRKASSHNSEHSQIQSLHNNRYGEEFDISKEQDGIKNDEDWFPSLTSENDKICSTSNTDVDSSWGECLVAKLAVSEMERQQQQQQQNQGNDHDDDDDFALQFVQLTKLSRPHRSNENDVDEARNVVENENNDDVQIVEDENNSVLVPNAKLKWNDTQLSKMRKRWWDAVRDKQPKDVERAMQHKSMMSLRKGDLDDERSTSSDSSSVFSSEDDDDDDPMQPPSLSTPFDELPIETAPTIHEQERVPPAVLELETLCCETTYPLHAIIYLHALQNPFISNAVGDARSVSSKSDLEVVVLNRLLTRHEQDDLDRWTMKRIGLEVLFQFSSPSTRIKDLFTSLHCIKSVEKEMTPLQLAIVLNCPDIVRLLSVSNLTHSSNKNESERSCTSLMLACELGHLACMKALLGSPNIKLDYRERGSRNTAYHYCCLGKISSNNGDDMINHNNVTAFDTLMSHTPSALRKRVLLLTNLEGQNLAHIACARGDLLLLNSVLGHLSGVSSQMPWKALTATDRLGHTPFISAVYAGKCDIVAHILITRFPASDYSVLFSACPLTIAASNYDIAMTSLLFEMGCDAQTTTTSKLSEIIRYDINRALLQLMLIRLGIKDGEEEFDADNNYELIRLLVAHGANPHKAVSIRTQQKPDTHGDEAIATLTGEEDTPLSVAVTAGDFQSIECMLQSYTHALTITQKLRRKDPLLISQPESYFRAVEERETDIVQCSLQSALVKALFLTWENGDFNTGKCSLVLYKRGVTLSKMSLQSLERCISMKRFIVSSSSSNDSIGYYFEAPLVQYALPKLSIDTIEDLNPYANVGTFMCWSQVLLELPWTNKFSFSCEWMRQSAATNSYQYKTSDIENDEFYLVVENERLLLHKSIISAKSGKLAAAIHFMEAQEQHSAENGKLHVSIDLPLVLAKMLICHCYHGSISFGLMASPLKRSEQLLELALIAEEYLCPSLLMEVEMRMLETKSNNCFCAYCSGAAMTHNTTCPIAVKALAQGGHNLGECRPYGVYFYKASRFDTSSLISPESAINVLAIAQQLELSSTNGSYAVKYTTKLASDTSTNVNVEVDKNAGVLTAPFLACKIFASYTLLRGFKLFMDQANARDEDDNDIPLQTGEGTPEVEENWVLLLRTCLEEVANNPLRRGKGMKNRRWLHSEHDSKDTYTLSSS